MTDAQILWDLDDDPQGNVQHLLEHGITKSDFEDVVLNPSNEVGVSRSSGERITFGWTRGGEHIAAVWEHVHDDPQILRPITAYPVPPRRRRKRGR